MLVFFKSSFSQCCPFMETPTSVVPTWSLLGSLIPLSLQFWFDVSGLCWASCVCVSSWWSGGCVHSSLSLNSSQSIPSPPRLGRMSPLPVPSQPNLRPGGCRDAWRTSVLCPETRSMALSWGSKSQPWCLPDISRRDKRQRRWYSGRGWLFPQVLPLRWPQFPPAPNHWHKLLAPAVQFA